MLSFSFIRWFKNISIARKLYFAVGIMAVLIAFELITLWFAVTTLSSVRAFVGGEGLWSKGQKDAVYHLRKYGRMREEKEYLLFQEFMKVPMGDHKTLVQLTKPQPDLDSARQGFLEGRNHPHDINGMINLFRRFYFVSYINRAIVIWSQADAAITPLTSIGEQLHTEINSPTTSPKKIEELLEQIDELNDKLTILEDDFSFTLGEGSRWLENIVLKLLLAVALTVELSGLLLTISVSRGIQKGLDEILRASKLIGKGDFTAKAKAYSEDEIGVLANSFNQMAEELGRRTEENKLVNESLKNYTRKLEQSNNNLEQFAYVASHDLQEPLRTITNFTKLLKEKQKDNPDAASKKYMNYVVNAAERMKRLIKDMLLFSRVGKQHIVELINFKDLLHEVQMDMELLISENTAVVKIENLPVLPASKTEMKLLFQNLITNAIKYRKADVTPHVEIGAHKQANGDWLFCVKDNGIGIDPEFKDKIFIIFQRLHNENEYSGTGIGLATCKKIVELNGGNIWVESKPDEGSIFYFTFPKT